MGDVSEYLPEESLTVTRIFEEYKKVGDYEPTRGYLGASIIGHSCERYLWYCFRQCCMPNFKGRMYRLFETGDREEERMVANLEAIGCLVHDHVEGPPGSCYTLEERKQRQFEVSALGGHFSGHMDGCALGIPEAPKTWHVLEFKTHNEKSFKKLVKEGVKKSKPMHYAQMQAYMHLTGMKRALYLAVNKNTDELYSERVRYDKDFCLALMEKAKRVITAQEPPQRAFNRRDYYECNWCDAKTICWGPADSEPALPVKSLSCRQCCHATPMLDKEKAEWNCRKHNGPTSRTPCKAHLCLPGLFSFADPEEYTKDDKTGHESIKFKNEDGFIWHHGNGPESFNSKELMTCTKNAISNSLVVSAKETFNAVVIADDPDILSRYPLEDCEIVWMGRESELPLAWKTTYKEDLMQLKMLNSTNSPDCRVAELPGERIAIVWSDGKAEIRKGKE